MEPLDKTPLAVAVAAGDVRSAEILLQAGELSTSHLLDSGSGSEHGQRQIPLV